MAIGKFIKNEKMKRVVEGSTIYNIIKQVANTAGSNKKIEILKKHKDDEGLKTILYYCYNGFLVYNIKKVSTIKPGGNKLIDDELPSFKELLNVLETRKVTGNSAIDMVKSYLSTFTIDSQELIIKVLRRDLKMGISAKTINKVWKNFIPVFDVALANKYNPEKQDIFDGNWLLSRKLDGIRVLSIIESGNIKFLSRKGKEFHTLGVLKEKIKSIAIKNNIYNGVFDGEICLVNDKGEEDFSNIMKQITRKDHTIKNPKYFIFDYITLEDFKNLSGKQTLKNRYSKLCNLKNINTENTTVLSQYDCTEENFKMLEKEVKIHGWEGLMARKDIGYEGKRSNNLVKIKSFFDAEYIVKDVIMEDITYTEKGSGQKTEKMLSAISIKHKGYNVQVGSGFTREQRKYYYENPNELIGKTVTVKYFEETHNKNGGISLRFPIVIYIYDNGREV